MHARHTGRVRGLAGGRALSGRAWEISQNEHGAYIESEDTGSRCVQHSHADRLAFTLQIQMALFQLFVV